MEMGFTEVEYTWDSDLEWPDKWLPGGSVSEGWQLKPDAAVDKEKGG